MQTELISTNLKVLYLKVAISRINFLYYITA